MQTNSSIFSPPIRWTLGVLSWLAFGVAAYLAWSAITSSSVAGCGVGSHNSCDVVLHSAWSKWLGIPVAVLGLAVYATLAGLSVMLAFQPSANRWITTAFVLLATLAAGASLWFIGIQIFAIGDFCMFCLTTDLSGIAIGAIAAWSAYRAWSGTPHSRTAGNSSTALSALRSAIPSSTRLAPVAAARTAHSSDAVQATTAKPTAPRTPSSTIARSVPLVGSSTGRRAISAPPSMALAFGGALALLLLLVSGQIVFPAKTYDVQQVALKDKFDLSADKPTENGGATPDGAATHVANRIPPDGDATPTDEKTDSTADTHDKSGNGTVSAGDSLAPKRERKIKLLGGKLTLDVGDEPIIGSVNAPHIVVEMVSYDCSHCRKSNRFIKKALARYGDQVALVVLSLPMESKCNRLITDPATSHAGACATTRTAIALAKLKPINFSRFHEFLMSGDEKEPPTLPSIVSKAFSMTDHTKLQVLRDSKEVENKVASYVNLFELLRQQSGNSKEFGLPIQILGDHVMSGSVEKAEDVYNAWEKHLGVKPR